jgi:hypothetical protein
MQIKKESFIQALANSILCPSDMKIAVSKEEKICGYSVDCKRCWDEALKSENNIKLIGGTTECQK